MTTSETPHAPDIWAPRRQMSLAKARRRSILVRWLRRLFLIGAAVCGGIFLGHIVASSITAATSGTIDLAEERIAMINPSFSGRDDSGEPYKITADIAERFRTGDDRVLLTSPRISDSFGGLVSAPKGIYDQEAQTLELTGNVVAADPGGYVFSSSRARIYLNEGRIVGLNPLRGNGPIGEFASNEYEILDDGSRLVMSGSVEITLYPKESDREVNQNAPR